MALEAIGMLTSAFAMIAVLSVYSCRLKGDDTETDSGNQSIFGVPEKIKTEG